MAEKDALQTLARLEKRVPELARQAMDYATLRMEQQAKMTTAFKDQTGNLRNSIRSEERRVGKECRL